ncbi:MAG TPA: extracellular solute-binding protein, partial [Chloroflexota bacterium]|nr:extracellular solute-binding protein [Chloroflexota bacterium]
MGPWVAPREYVLSHLDGPKGHAVLPGGRGISFGRYAVDGLWADFTAAMRRADVFPAMLESALWAGKLVSFPAYANNQAMIYNTGLLQQAGVVAPRQGWTWDDFRTSAQRVVHEGILPLSMGWVNTWQHWLGTMGSRIVSKDVRKINA